jgi:phosphinothricin acetyltransferase
MAIPEDGEAVARIYGPFVRDTAISFETEIPDAAEMGRRIGEVSPAYPWIMAEVDGEVVGYAYGHAFAARAAYGWSVETSIYLDGDSRGRGVGTTLYRALLPILARQGYRQAFAGVSLPNPASVALHERAGFVRAATYTAVGWKFGRWHDVGWWQRPLGGDGPAGAPLTVPGLPDGFVRSTLDKAGNPP